MKLNSVLCFIILFLSIFQINEVFSQGTAVSSTFIGTPPSCVITSPHVNAYFEVGNAITINVYAQDFGGTHSDGTIERVEFYNDTEYLDEVLVGANGTYKYVWNCVPAGVYLLKARAIDNDGNVVGSAGVKVTVGLVGVTQRGLSAGKGKYLGNIVPGTYLQIRTDYVDLWNAVSAENDCKWGSVEGQQGVYNWTGADRAYNLAADNNLAYRYHALSWANQYPCWAISGQGCAGGNNSGVPTLQITPTAFATALDDYMAAVAARYGENIDQLDVLNENLQFGSGGEHAPATGVFRTAIHSYLSSQGVSYGTSYDWIVWLFERARYHFPNSKLVLNDYGLENDVNGAVADQLAVIKVLRDRALIDGFGTQAHEFNINNLSSTQLQNALDVMDNSGVPTYVTELDIGGTAQEQLQRYQNLFPVYWNHPSVAGISLWGYVDGELWKPTTGLVDWSSGSPVNKPAMDYIETFVAAQPTVDYPFATQASSAGCNFVQDLTILTQPEDTQVTVGDDATFEVVAVGEGILTYEWFVGGLAVPNSNASTLVLSNLQDDDDATVYVVVSDDNGSIQSDNATLDVVSQAPYNGLPIPIPGIVEVEQFDIGGQGIAYNELGDPNAPANSIRTNETMTITNGPNGGHVVAYLAAGEWMEYTVEVLTDGQYELSFNYANGTADVTADLDFTLDGVDLAVDLPAAPTGSWGTYQTHTHGTLLDLIAGVYVLRVTIDQPYLNFDYIEFSPVEVPCDQKVVGTRAVDIVANSSCVDGNWRHFYTMDNPNQILFSMNENANTNLNCAATIDVYDPIIYEDATIPSAEYVLGRSWSMNCTGSDYNASTGMLTSPVDVRFYYTEDEYNVIVTAADIFRASLGMLPGAEVNWVKSKEGQTFNPNGILNGSSEVYELQTTVEGDVNGVKYVELQGVVGFSGGTGVVSESLTLLDVAFKSFDVVSDEQGIVVNWEVEDQSTTGYYVVQRSTNAIDFEDVELVYAHENSKYSFLDKVEEGKYYYRIEAYDGVEVVVSELIAVERLGSISISFANPYTGGEVKLINNIETALLSLYDATGRLLQVDSLLSGKVVRYQGFSDGVYLLVVNYENGLSETYSLVFSQD